MCFYAFGSASTHLRFFLPVQNSSRAAAVVVALLAHLQLAKKRRARATDTYIVYEPYTPGAPTERIGRFTAGMKVEAVDITQVTEVFATSLVTPLPRRSWPRLVHAAPFAVRWPCTCIVPPYLQRHAYLWRLFGNTR
jgi:hypothetical protein